MPNLTVEEEQRRIARDKRLVLANQTAIAKLRRELRHQTATKQRRAARLRHEQHELALLQRQRTGADAAVSFALWAAKQGIYEKPAGSNSGPYITDWIRAAGGSPGQPWCQYFADAVMVHGGVQQMRDGYTPDFISYGRTGQYGFRLVPLAQIQPGDLIYYKWPGVSSAACDHVGVYVGNGEDVEGNTSPGRSGSQNNGGGCYLRKLDSQRRPYIVAVVRPPYPAHH